MKVEIFSAADCDYCRRAKTLLMETRIEFEELDIALDHHREDLVKRLPRTRSLPQIFFNGEHVGGYEDLEILKTRGELNKFK